MSVILGDNQYGKSGVRLVTVAREAGRHQVTDLTVDTTLAGDFADSHLTGDNGKIVATDSQRNTVYAFARAGVGEPEEFALRLARHFVATYPSVERARIEVRQHPWSRLEAGGEAHPHAFVRSGEHTRSAVATSDGSGTWVVSGISGMLLLKTTGSGFSGFIRDAYTTLPETDDRILATSVTARWRHGSLAVDWADSFASARRALLDTFAAVHSLALQQTLFRMGEAVIDGSPEIAEVRLSLPNRHHQLADLSAHGLDNPDQVYVALDRPYGLIEGTILRPGAAGPGLAWW